MSKPGNAVSIKPSNSPPFRSRKKGTTFTSKPDIKKQTGWPRRIACITAETTELIFALGAGDRIVGVSGFSVRPAEARSKPKVAAFTSVRLDKLRELRPDLVLGFSDLQKDIARELVAEGFTIFISNQRTLQEIGDMILAIGRLIGAEKKAVSLHANFWKELEKCRGAIHRASTSRVMLSRPRIYFEEWDNPLISGISWVSELIEFLGGEDVFKKNRAGQNAKDRVIRPEEVIAADPDAIIASWCGKKVQFEKIKSRPGWEQIKAVRNNYLYEIKSSDILAPGLSLLHGARRMAEIIWKVTRFSRLTALKKAARLPNLYATSGKNSASAFDRRP